MSLFKWLMTIDPLFGQKSWFSYVKYFRFYSQFKFYQDNFIYVEEPYSFFHILSVFIAVTKCFSA